MARRRPSAVPLANEKVSIVYACQLIGMDVPEDVSYGRALKVHCPFGPLYHRDQGAEAAMRVYVEDNHAWCFAGCGYFTPVWLCAQAWDRDPQTVAVELLERIGYQAPTVADAWREIVDYQPRPDPTLLAEALKTFCARICADWGAAQFTPATAATLRRCLMLLDHVHTDQQARQWLVTCKTVMRHALQTVDGRHQDPVFAEDDQRR